MNNLRYVRRNGELVLQMSRTLSRIESYYDRDLEGVREYETFYTVWDDVPIVDEDMEVDLND